MPRNKTAFHFIWYKVENWTEFWAIRVNYIFWQVTGTGLLWVVQVWQPQLAGFNADENIVS